MSIKKYAFTLIVIVSMGLQAFESFVVESIESVDLYQHRQLYQKFIQYYCALCPCDVLSLQAIEHQFDQEEVDYQLHNPTTLFFHAKVQDDIVGYISCDIGLHNQVVIRQLVFDPNMFDATMVKELLFAIFSRFPQTKKITLQSLTTCDDLSNLLRDVGFSQIKPTSLDDMYYHYELHLSSKCKICDVLYNPEFWNQPDDQEDGYESEDE